MSTITALITRAIRRARMGHRRGGMTGSGRPTRPGRRRPAAWAAWPAAVAALALLLAGAPAYAATGAGPAATSARGSAPPPAPHRGAAPPAHRMRALPPLPQDLSATLPNLDYGQAVGDFTGVGHDELAYAQDGQLKIANVTKFGGQVLRSTPTDLKATPNDGFQYCNADDGGQCLLYTPFDSDAFTNAGATYGMTGVKVAASASYIYMAGATWDTRSDGAAVNYKLHLYMLPHAGSCARISCALAATANLPSTFVLKNGFDSSYRVVVVTSLAVGVVGGRTLIAVGLSDYGIYIYDDNLNLVAHLADMADGRGSQTPVTALAFGAPSGPGQGGVLAGGVESDVNSMFTWQLNADGTEKSVAKSPPYLGGTQFMAAAVTQLGGRTVSVFTRSDGDVIALNPDTGALITDLQPASSRAGQPTGLTAVTPWDGDPGNQELVVGKLDGTTDQVLEDVGGTLTPVPFAPGNATTGTADQAYAWYPGYGAGNLYVLNNTPGTVSVAMASRPDPQYGCWLNTSVAHPPVPAFPVSDTPVPGGGIARGEYFVAALTGASGGNSGEADGPCASARGQGERSAYVIITPAGDRADEHIVKLQSSQDGTLSVADQAGGYLTAALAQVSSTPGSWGTWTLTLTGGTTPQAAAPTVTGFRLTAAPGPDYTPPTSPLADDPCRPVFRFDVTGATWTDVAAAGQVTARIPAMTAQGSSDGGATWTDLGQLMPATAPAVAADGTVTLGPASFFFQNPPGTAVAPGADPAGVCPATATKPPVTEVRVMSGGQASSPVTLAGLTAPPVNGGTGATPIGGVSVTPTAASNIAAPRADGVDQATLGVELKPSNSGGLIPVSDPRYQLIYYRQQDTNALVTGLYQPGGYSGYTAVGPQQGPFASPAGPGQVSNYLVTTTTAAQSLIGVINDSGTAGGLPSGSFNVAATRNPLTPAGASATGGIGISGCASSPTATCTLAEPAAVTPALYQAGDPADGPVTGLQLAATAITGRASLPLQVGTANAHGLGSAPLTVTPSQAKLVDTSGFFPGDTIDTALVTEGELVPVLSIPVGNGS